MTQDSMCVHTKNDPCELVKEFRKSYAHILVALIRKYGIDDVVELTPAEKLEAEQYLIQLMKTEDVSEGNTRLTVRKK